MQTNSGHHAMINHRLLRYSTVFLRVALGVTFLTAVADRFGLWGPPGADNVVWGNFENFFAYTAQLNPYLHSTDTRLLSPAATPRQRRRILSSREEP